MFVQYNLAWPGPEILVSIQLAELGLEQKWPFRCIGLKFERMPMYRDHNTGWAYKSIETVFDKIVNDFTREPSE